MFIKPISPIKGINQIEELKTDKINKSNNNLFKSIFESAVDNYKEAEATVDEDINNLTMGETDDLHSLMINAQKAELSLELVIQIRNKTLEAYNEIMRMGV